MVRNYRGDLLEDSDLNQLDSYIETCKRYAKAKKVELPDAAAAEAEISKIDEFLSSKGGLIYKNSLAKDLAHHLSYFALVVIGFATFFLKPMNIPTNSMYPSLNGMLAEVYEPDAGPNLVERMFRLLSRGAHNHRIIAEDSGYLYIPLRRSSYYGLSPYNEKHPGRRLIVLPEMKRRYYFLVGDTLQHFDLPEPFDARDIFEPFYEHLEPEYKHVPELMNVPFVKTNIRVDKGAPVLNFDRMMGDCIFVDRFSYHFRKPDVGETFVFRTENIDTIENSLYYIKRLVGQEQDMLRIEPPVLYRNDEVITGSDAFDMNNRAEGEYEGYVPAPTTGSQFLGEGQEVTVPSGNYFVIGDNADNSADGRHWGFVPEKAVIGRGLIVLYPFTKNWGFIK